MVICPVFCQSTYLTSCRNDILRKHGIIPEKPPDPEPIIQEALIEAEQKAYENRLEDKDLDELDELEDEEDEEFLEQYRYVSSVYTYLPLQPTPPSLPLSTTTKYQIATN